MNRFARTALVASVLVAPLAACSSWDPTDMFDNSFFNPKKPLPGDRKPLFPEGTPGVPQGVPADLYKGYQAPAAQNGQDNDGKSSLASTQPAGQSPDAPPDKPKPKPKPKPKVAAAPPPPKATPTAVTVRPGPSAAPSEAASPWPAPPQQTGQAPAPSSPSGGQNIWPDPPAPGTVGR
jgi:hypothetical protein